MAEAEGMDFTKIPLLALRTKARCTLSHLLNSCKVIPSPSGLPRDWRGLGHISEAFLPTCSCPDPTGNILTQWEKRKATFQDLIDALTDLDRFDALDDSINSLTEDAKYYLLEPNDAVVIKNLESDKHILTVDDIHRIENGMEPQYYDAFLLYSDEDSEFAEQIIENLENKYNLKLCIKNRDLIGGVNFEHEAIMRIISERCNRLITVVSPSFLNSPANKFFVTYAQALGIEQRQRKIVPCIYQRMILPPHLRYYFVLDFSRTSRLWDFWDRLYRSVTAPVSSIPQIKEIPCIKETGAKSKGTECISFPIDWHYDKPKPEIEIETETKEKNEKQSPTLTMIKKLLPDVPSGRLGTKSWFIKKKKKKKTREEPCSS